MKFESRINKPSSPEEKIRNYEKDADKRTEEENTFLQNISGKGLNKEGRIMLDAQLEDKYRDLEKKGIIGKEEFEVLIRSNVNRKLSGDGSRDVIEGVFNGVPIKITKPHADERYVYKGEVNNETVDSKTAELLFEELSKEIGKRNKILEKIKRDEIKDIIEDK